nr:MAG: putative capsid protein [Arizlama virus]
MGYKRARSRRFVKRRRPIKRRRTMRYGGMLRTAAWAAKQVWKLKGLVNSEMYKYDQTDVTLSPLLTGVVQPMVSITQGDGDDQRTGNSVFVRSVNFKGYIQRNTSGDSSQIVRISIVQDTQQQADAAPGFSNIYEGTSIASHLNTETVGRFKVMYNRVFTVDDLTCGVIPFEINMPMRHHVRYNGSSPTDIQKGGLYFIAVSTQGTTNAPLVHYDMRISYHDN